MANKRNVLKEIFSPSKKTKQRQKEEEERKKLRYDLKKALDHK